MNLATHYRGSLTTPSTVARARPTRARRSRAADYVADVCLVALLAAPFVLFEAPSTLPDAVILSRAAPVTLAQPAPAAPDARTTGTDR